MYRLANALPYRLEGSFQLFSARSLSKQPSIFKDIYSFPILSSPPLITLPPGENGVQKLAAQSGCHSVSQNRFFGYTQISTDKLGKQLASLPFFLRNNSASPLGIVSAQFLGSVSSPQLVPHIGEDRFVALPRHNADARPLNDLLLGRDDLAGLVFGLAGLLPISERSGDELCLFTAVFIRDTGPKTMHFHADPHAWIAMAPHLPGSYGCESENEVLKTNHRFPHNVNQYSVDRFNAEYRGKSQSLLHARSSFPSILLLSSDTTVHNATVKMIEPNMARYTVVVGLNFVIPG